MSDLEAYLFDRCGGEVTSTWFQGTGIFWERHVTVAATERIVVLTMLFRFIAAWATAGVSGDEAAISFCLSTGTDNTAVAADSNKIHVIDRLQSCQTVEPVFFNLEGCPVIGNPGQHMHLKGWTTEASEKPTAIIQYMVIK